MSELAKLFTESYTHNGRIIKKSGSESHEHFYAKRLLVTHLSEGKAITMFTHCKQCNVKTIAILRCNDVDTEVAYVSGAKTIKFDVAAGIPTAFAIEVLCTSRSADREGVIWFEVTSEEIITKLTKNGSCNVALTNVRSTCCKEYLWVESTPCVNIMRPRRWQNKLVNKIIADKDTCNAETILWVFDWLGGSGKTWTCKYLRQIQKGRVISVNIFDDDGYGYMMDAYGNGWNGELLLLDMFRSHKEKDVYNFITKMKSDSKFKNTKVVVFSCTMPDVVASQINPMWWRIYELTQSEIVGKSYQEALVRRSQAKSN